MLPERAKSTAQHFLPDRAKRLLYTVPTGLMPGAKRSLGFRRRASVRNLPGGIRSRNSRLGSSRRGAGTAVPGPRGAPSWLAPPPTETGSWVHPTFSFAPSEGSRVRSYSTSAWRCPGRAQRAPATRCPTRASHFRRRCAGPACPSWRRRFPRREGLDHRSAGSLRQGAARTGLHGAGVILGDKGRPDHRY
jgi:hypothetical protein